MRLLYVHESFGSFGGAEANIFATATELKRRGHRAGLLTQRRTGHGEAAWEALFGEDLFWLENGSPNEAAQRFEADAIYVHKWEDLASIEQLLAGDAPLVRMVHDHDIYCLRSYRYNPLTRHICQRPLGVHCVLPCLAPLKRNHGGILPVRWAGYFQKQRELALARRFHRSVVATRYMRDELLRNGFAPECIEIHAPVPPPVEPLRSRFSERNLLIYAGQLVRGKGVDVLLRSLAQVRGNFEALILGEGSHRAKCEKLARKLGLENRVTFKGFIPQTEMRALYQDATAVLVSSVWPEPMGLVGLEAMRYALPVVAFDAGGIGEWLSDGENGFLVPWMDTELYAARIDELLADKHQACLMGARGLERVTREFNFENYISGLEDLFARVTQAADSRCGTEARLEACIA